MLKKDLIKQNEELKALLKDGQGHTITGCNVTIDDSKEHLAIASAVEEGMIALQKIASNRKYGIYLK